MLVGESPARLRPVINLCPPDTVCSPGPYLLAAG
jgi:hypothetical protein